MASSQVHTYHCICSELVLALFSPLDKLPKRQGDGSAICKITKSDLPIPGGVVLSGSTFDQDNPIILKLDDGFEKRYAVTCQRCDLQIGYRLDRSQFDDSESGVRADVLYLLPGGLLSTDEMKEGKDRSEAVESGADHVG